MGVFYVFKIVHMVTNRAKRLYTLLAEWRISQQIFSSIRLETRTCFRFIIHPLENCLFSKTLSEIAKENFINLTSIIITDFSFLKIYSNSFENEMNWNLIYSFKVLRYNVYLTYFGLTFISYFSWKHPKITGHMEIKKP